MSNHPRRLLRGLLLALLAIVAIGGGYAGFRWYTAKSHLDSAKNHFDHFRYEAAYSEIVQSLPYYSDQPDVVLLAARMARRAGFVSEARGYLESLGAGQPKGDSEASPSRPLADAVRLEFLLLDAQEGKASTFSAKALFDRAETDAENRDLILEALFRGAFSTYRLNSALEFINKWLAASPADPRPYYWHGLILNKKNPKGPESIRALEKALERNPDYNDARVALAEQYLEAADYSAAEPHFRYLEQTQPGAAVSIGLGRCRAAAGDPVEAQKRFRAALAAEPEHALAHRELGILLMQHGSLDDAVAHLKQAQSIWPHDVSTSYNHYQVLRRLGREQEAEEQLARHKTLEGRQRRLRKLLYSELQERPGDVDAMTEAGKIQLTIGGQEYETIGLWWLQRALHLNPRHKPAYAVLAEYYSHKNNLEMAERCRRLAQ